jgi:hypothetical protein
MERTAIGQVLQGAFRSGAPDREYYGGRARLIQAAPSPVRPVTRRR